MWTRPIWSGLLKWRLAKGKSIWPQLRSDAEYSWLNLGWSVKIQPKTLKEPINEMVRQNPRQLVTLLNWTRRWSEWKRKISRRGSIVFLLCCAWLLERNGMKSISSRMKRRVNLFGINTMWMWLSVFHMILECMECEENRKCNNVSVNVEFLYSTLEIVQQGKKEGRKEGCVS